MPAPHPDTAQIALNSTGLLILNISLAVILFGIALDIQPSDFRFFRTRPRAVVVGLLSQWVLLPALTLGIILLMKPLPSLALGMVLVASCPGGNVSNFFVHWSRGNSALSVTLTTISTLAAVVITPLNFELWSSMVPGAEELRRSLALNPLDMVETVVLIIGLPLALGMFIGSRYPALRDRLRKPMKIFSLIFFTAFVVLALQKNWDLLLTYGALLLGTVVVHNTLAFALGYGAAWAARLPEQDRRAIAIETGIQNAGLGLILVLDVFRGLGGMALINATWGVWHLLSGFGLASYFRGRVVRRPAPKA